MKKKYKILLIVAIILVIIIIAGAVIFSTFQTNLNKLTTVTITDVDLTKIEDGTYLGSYGSFPVSAEVQVIVADHKITNIKILMHNNGQGANAEVIPENVIAAQSLEIDIVSGATYSSKVILKSIQNALKSEKL